MEGTEEKREKWGQIIALSLPEKDPSDIRNKVFESLGESDLKGVEGFQKLFDFLDKELVKRRFMTFSTSPRSLRFKRNLPIRLCNSIYPGLSRNTDR